MIIFLNLYEFHDSQELLEAVEMERSLRDTPSRNAAIFHHSEVGDFELQHVSRLFFFFLLYILAVSTSCFHHLYMLSIFFLVQLPMGHESDIEERIIRHLAAAASMRRAHLLGQREIQRTRSSAHGHPHYFVYSTQPSAPPSAAGGGSEPAAIPVGNPSAPLIFDGTEQSSPEQMPLFQTRGSSLTSGSSVTTTNVQGVHSNHR